MVIVTVREVNYRSGMLGGQDQTSDEKPSYFTTTFEPRTLGRGWVLPEWQAGSRG